SSGVGAVDGRGAHADESHDANSQARVESADGGTGGASQADEAVVHPDDARAAEEGWEAGAQGASARAERTQQAHRRARGAALGQEDVAAQFGADAGDCWRAKDPGRRWGPWLRQQTEPGDVGGRRDLQRDLPKSSGRTEEADEGRKVCGVAEAARANGSADLD